MAALQTSFAWTVEVPTDILGAHLQAYTSTLDAITTLRLCNRHGVGEKAAITKLPAELITQIETYVAKDERTKQRKTWTKSLLCWESRCEPLDHFSEEQCQSMLADMDEYMYPSDEDSEHDEESQKQSDERRRSCLNEMMGEEMADERPEGIGWYKEHMRTVEEWMILTDQSNGEGAGFFAKHSDLVLRTFGLQIWICDASPVSKPKPSSPGSFGHTTTITYLTLPSPSLKTNVDRIYKSHYDTIYDEVEPPLMSNHSGQGIPVAFPSQLSAADISRFTRACKILDLTPCDITATKPQLFASSKDKADADECDKADKDGEKVHVPKLRILLNRKLEAEDNFW